MSFFSIFSKNSNEKKPTATQYGSHGYSTQKSQDVRKNNIQNYPKSQPIAQKTSPVNNVQTTNNKPPTRNTISNNYYSNNNEYYNNNNNSIDNSNFYSVNNNVNNLYNTKVETPQQRTSVQSYPDPEVLDFDDEDLELSKDYYLTNSEINGSSSSSFHNSAQTPVVTQSVSTIPIVSNNINTSIQSNSNYNNNEKRDYNQSLNKENYSVNNNVYNHDPNDQSNFNVNVNDNSLDNNNNNNNYNDNNQNNNDNYDQNYSFDNNNYGSKNTTSYNINEYNIPQDIIDNIPMPYRMYALLSFIKSGSIYPIYYTQQTAY